MLATYRTELSKQGQRQWRGSMLHTCASPRIDATPTGSFDLVANEPTGVVPT